MLDDYSFKHAGSCGPTTVETATECASAASAVGVAAHGVVANASASLPAGCLATVRGNGAWDVTYNADHTSSAPCGGACTAGATVVVASGELGGVSVVTAADHGARTVTLTITSNAAGTAWFGVGLNATQMDGAHAYVVDGEGQLSEHLLSNHMPGSLLPLTAKVISSTSTGGVRTVVASIPFATAGIDFAMLGAGTLPVVTAIGSTPTFSYHKYRTAGTVGVGVAEKPVCICRDPTKNAGSIDGIRFDPTVCAPFPTGEQLSSHNAICNVSEYNGGLYCCHGGTILLDAEQTQPNKTVTWRMKYRWYVEEHKNQSNLFRSFWSTEAYNNEYDVPKSTADCLDPATDPKLCVHTIKSQFQARDMLTSVANPTHASACMVTTNPNACANVDVIAQKYGGYFQLAYAAFHCHAPACMTGELWNADTGELLCRNTAEYGSGSTPLNESAYVVGIPPCLWGTADEGLRPPLIFHLDTNLTTIKRANNTNGHWGAMALWQSRAAYMTQPPLL